MPRYILVLLVAAAMVRSSGSGGSLVDAQPKLSRFAAYVLPQGGVQVSWVSDVPVAAAVLEAQSGDTFRKIAAETPAEERRNHRVTTNHWKPGSRVRIRVHIIESGGKEFVSPVVDLEIPGQVSNRLAREQTVPLDAASPLIPERPIIAGIPFAPDQLWRAEQVWVEAGHQSCPSQISISSRWPDGSARWLLARIQPPAKPADFQLRVGTERSTVANPFKIRASSSGLAIGNGRLNLRFHKRTFALFEEVTDGNGLAWSGKPELGKVQITSGDGTMFGLGPPDKLEVEERGPVQAVVLAEGPFRNQSGANWFRYRVRYFLTGDSPLVRVQLTFINDIMKPEFQALRSIVLTLPIGGRGTLRGQLEGDDMQKIDQSNPSSIRQITDNRLRVTAREGATERDEQAIGWAVVERGPARVALVFRDFWQTWPKGLVLGTQGIEAQILPPLAQDEYAATDLQDWLRHYFWFDRGQYQFKRGMAMRVEFSVRFGRTNEALPTGGWDGWAKSLQTLPYAMASPAHNCASGAFGPVLSASDTDDPEYEAMVREAVASMARGHEELREYGWMNFGDWYGERQFNWGNDEYDWPWATALHFARTGRWDYLRSGEEMARHSATIDAIHIPWAAGMAGRSYMHSVGHVGMSSEPPKFAAPDSVWDKYREARKGFVRGGVDPSGHIFEEGKFAMYMLTGDRDLLEAAEFSVAAQAEHLTPQFDFHIERGAGWPLINAVAAYEGTDNPFYLNAARLYVERILQKQDPHNGGWMLPQDPNECDHPPPHLGGKPFATGVLLYGLMRYDLVQPSPEVKHSIVRACGWLVEEGWNRQKDGFRYKTGCSKYADSADNGGCMGLCSAGLAYGWKLTADKRFAEILAAGFRQMCREAGTLGKGDTMMVRQSAFALPMMKSGKPKGGENPNDQ